MTNLRGFDFKRNSPCQYQMKCVEKSMKNMYININPLAPTSDQDRISPYNIKQASDKNIEKILIRGLFVDPIPNYPN